MPQHIPYEPRSIFVIGRCLGRLCRFAGAAPQFYSVFQHSLVVALLLPAPLRILGLTHDISEAYTNDQVSLYKRENFRIQEQELTERIYKDHDLVMPTPEEHAAVKSADRRALVGEIWTGGGEEKLKAEYPQRDSEAEELTLKALSDWPATRLVETNDAGFEFVRLFEQYRN